MRGTNVQNAGGTNVVNTQDSQEPDPCATYWFLGLIQVPHKHRCTLWDSQRAVRVSLLGSDDSQGPGFRCEHLMLAFLPVHYVLYRGQEGIYRSSLDA
eukprot:7057457-Pyramimonas_sp.AAC.1